MSLRDKLHLAEQRIAACAPPGRPTDEQITERLKALLTDEESKERIQAMLAYTGSDPATLHRRERLLALFELARRRRDEERGSAWLSETH